MIERSHLKRRVAAAVLVGLALAPWEVGTWNLFAPNTVILPSILALFVVFLEASNSFVYSEFGPVFGRTFIPPTFAIASSIATCICAFVVLSSPKIRRFVFGSGASMRDAGSQSRPPFA